MSKKALIPTFDNDALTVAGSWRQFAFVALLVCFGCGTSEPPKQQPPVRTAAARPATAAEQPKSADELVTMDVAKAVMVTVELDFGPKVPSIAQALAEVERRYQPDDGRDRTFSVLDAYGEPTPDNKLHMSMHVSSEKPGLGWLVFKRTGEGLWRGENNTPPQPNDSHNNPVSIDNNKRKKA